MKTRGQKVSDSNLVERMQSNAVLHLQIVNKVSYYGLF